MRDLSWKMRKNQNIPGGSEEKHEKHVRVSGLRIEIWSRNLRLRGRNCARLIRTLAGASYCTGGEGVRLVVRKDRVVTNT